MFGVFSPQQARSIAQKRATDDAVRAKKIADLTDDLLKEHSNVERLFDEEQVRRRKEAEDFIHEFTLKKQALLQEVERLEERRKEALKPPLIRAEDIQSVEEGLHARDLELRAKKQDLDEEGRLLMRKLDELSEQKLSLEEREARVKRSEANASALQQQASVGMKRLNERMADFLSQKEDQEQQFAFRQSEQDARENLLNERDASFAEREHEIEVARKVLLDQRVQLDKGFEELKRLRQKYDY